MGATPKKDSPDPLNPIMRPTDDHTKTGTNGITLMGFLRYALTAYEDVAWLLKQDYFMYVSDVEDAFLLLPLAPWLWYLMLFRCFLSDVDKEERASRVKCSQRARHWSTRATAPSFVAAI